MVYQNPLKVIFPFYHSVCDNELKHLKHLYSIKSVNSFKKDLDFFLKYYNPLSINDLQNSFQNNISIEKPSFLLTFDDGFSQVYDVIAPILKEKGIPAIFFLNTSFLNNNKLFFRCKISLLIDKLITNNISDATLAEINMKAELKLNSKHDLIKFLQSLKYQHDAFINSIAIILEFDFHEYLEKEKPYLTHNQVKDLVLQGFHIGSHSCDHPLFGSIGIDEQLNQVKDSLSLLKTNFDLPISSFSFPFSDYGVHSEFFNTVYNSNAPILDFSFGTAGLKYDSYPQHLQRIPMEKFPYNAPAIMLFQYFYWLLKAPIGKNRIVRT